MNEDRKLVMLNVVSAGAQVVVVGAVYFFLYRFLVKTLGVELLGVWSVVMATSSIVNLANFGVSTAVTRFISLYTREGKQDRINKLIFTCAGFIFLFFGVISLATLLFGRYLLSFVIDKDYIERAVAVLPYSILCLIINAVAGVYLSAIDGLQKNYIRSLIFTVGAFLFLLLTLILMKGRGLEGVVISQVYQSLFVLIASLVAVRVYTGYNLLKWQWSNSIFKEIFSYGFKFQVISLAALFNEPVTKMLLAKFGGLQLSGYYEMASRLLMQLRGIVVNANQSLLPVLSRRETDSSEDVNPIYKTSIIIIVIVALYIMGAPVVLNGFISLVWIGAPVAAFNQIMTLLAVSVFVNLLSTPAYFGCLAQGKLRSVILAQCLIAVINFLVGIFLGKFFGGYGVISSWLLASVVGSLFLLFKYQNDNKVKLRRDVYVFTCCLITVTVVASVIKPSAVGVSRITLYYKSALAILAYSIVYGTVCWFFFKRNIFRHG